MFTNFVFYGQFDEYTTRFFFPPTLETDLSQPSTKQNKKRPE